MLSLYIYTLRGRGEGRDDVFSNTIDLWQWRWAKTVRSWRWRSAGTAEYYLGRDALRPDVHLEKKKFVKKKKYKTTTQISFNKIIPIDRFRRVLEEPVGERTQIRGVGALIFASPTGYGAEFSRRTATCTCAYDLYFIGVLRELLLRGNNVLAYYYYHYYIPSYWPCFRRNDNNNNLSRGGSYNVRDPFFGFRRYFCTIHPVTR